jgi:hypothetical protein
LTRLDATNGFGSIRSCDEPGSGEPGSFAPDCSGWKRAFASTHQISDCSPICGARRRLKKRSFPSGERKGPSSFWFVSIPGPRFRGVDQTPFCRKLM